MPYISRQVGTVSSLVTLFLNDRTVSTGAGLANIVASTVRITWLRSDQAAVSSWTLTTGTLGTWTGSTMTQVGSTSTLGAYQFSLPDGAFVSGDSVYIQFMSSTSAFAEVPLVIELTKTNNQTYLSSQMVGSVNAPVGVSTLPAVSSITTPVTASSVTGAVNVSSIYGSAAVTSAAGVWGPLAVSSISIPVGVSTITAGALSTHSISSVLNEVGVIARNITVSTATASSVHIQYPMNAADRPIGSWIYVHTGLGSTQSRRVIDWENDTSTLILSPSWVTTPNSTSVIDWIAGYPYPTSTGTIPPVHISSSGVNLGVSTLTVAAISSFFTMDAGDYSTSVLGSVVQEIADNVSATVGAQVGVSSISIPVSVSSVTAAVNVSAVHGSAFVTSAAGVLGPLAVSSVVAGALSTHSISSVINEGGVIHRGVAVSSTASTIQLDVTLSTYPNDVGTGSIIFIKSGTGKGQSRVVEDWTSTDSLAAISPNWTVNPTSTSAYEWHAAAPSTNSTFPLVTLASTQILVGASTVTTPVTASSVTAGVNVTSFVGSAAVTSAAGVLGPVRVSSISIPVSVSSGVVAVSTITVAAMSSFFTLDAGDYSTSVLGSVVQEIADNVSATVGAQVGVSSISIPVSVSAVTVPVSTATPVTVSNMTVGALTRFFDTGAVFFSTAVVSSVAFEIATNVKPPAGVGVSSIATPVTASSVSAPVGVSTLPAVSSITTPVSASSVTVPVGVSTLTVAAVSSLFTLDAGDYSTSVLGSVVKEIADNVSATVGAQVGVSSISIPVSVSSVTVTVSANIVKVRNTDVTGSGTDNDPWGP
jgi:hypothetical protein